MSGGPAGPVEGAAFPPFAVTPGMEAVIRYCGLTGGLTPIFFDADAAVAAGMPAPIVPGMLKTWYLYRALETWFGEAAVVRHVRATHRRPDLLGRPMAVHGTIARVFEEAGARMADVEIVVLDADGQPTVQGFGTVALR